MKRWIPTREQLRRSRWLRPVARHLDHEHLWRTDRASVARAAAIGLFIGVLIPFAQFLFAIVLAIGLRAHVAIAAGFTFITNPLTFAPIYWLAHRIGHWVLRTGVSERQADSMQRQAEAVAGQRGFIEGMWYAVQSAGLPLIVGLAILASLAGLIGFTLMWLLWRRPADDETPPPAETPPRP